MAEETPPDELEQLRAENARLVETLEKVEASLGDRLLARGPLSIEYAHSVLAEINQTLATATKAAARRGR